MKCVHLMLAVTALVLSNIFTSAAQTAVPGISLQATNYKFLKSVAGKDEPQPVQALPASVNTYDVKTLGYYEDDYDSYFISFIIPDGQTLAAYDRNGKLIRMAEKYEVELLPTTIPAAIAKKYPNWVISKSIFLVTYYGDRSNETRYKITLENGTKRIKVKANDDGELF